MATTKSDSPETDPTDDLGLGVGGIDPAVFAFVHPGSSDALDVNRTI